MILTVERPKLTKPRTLGLLTTVLLGLACNERLLDPNEIPSEPLCMYASGTKGTRTDGTSSPLLRPDGRGFPYVCSCITEEQYEDESELQSVKEEMNDRLLEECERVANVAGFVSNDCELDHELGSWIGWWFFASDEFFMALFSVSCEGEGWIPESEPEPPICELGDPGCSCTVEAKCTGGTTCIDGMCQPPPP